MFRPSSRTVFRSWVIAVFSAICALNLYILEAEQSDTSKPKEPTKPQALKSYQAAFDWVKAGAGSPAISAFLKANKQEGHCAECLRQAYSLARSMGRYKQAEEIAREWLPTRPMILDVRGAHYRIGLALQHPSMQQAGSLCQAKIEQGLEFQPEPEVTEVGFPLRLFSSL